jgi:predicted nucleic acid-binding protein
MICADTCSIVALLEGGQGSDVKFARQALRDGALYIAPITVSELLSDADLPPSVEELVIRIPQLEIKPGYWQRAGRLRALLMRGPYRPKVADRLIAQSRIDHQVPLVTRDQDFQAFREYAGLRLL